MVKVKGLLDKNTYQNFFIIGTVCLSIRSVFGLSQMDNAIFRNLTIVAYALMLIKIIHTEFDRKKILMLMTGCLIALSVMLSSGSTIALGTVLFIYGMRGVEINKTLKANAIGLSVAVIIVVLVALGGEISLVVNNNLSFGFNNPNGFQSFVSSLTILFIASNIKKIKILGLSFFLIINFVTSTLAGARTGYLVVVFIFILILVLKRPGQKKGKISLKVENIYLLIVVGTLICVLLYDVFIPIKWLDLLLSGRLYQANHYLMQYGIKLFGNTIVELNPEYTYWHLLLDCGYARLFINYGAIFGYLFIWAHYKVLKKARIRRQLNIIVALLGFAVIMMVENGGIGINFNMSLLLLCEVFEEDRDLAVNN